MLKRTLYIILLGILPFITFAQKKLDFTIADKFFNSFQYELAAEEYNKLHETDKKNHKALYQLAECYRLTFNYEKAEKFYYECTHTHMDEYPLSKYWYGIMLKNNSKYDEAKKSLELFKKTFKSNKPEDKKYLELADVAIGGCDYALTEMKKPAREYVFKNLPSPVNTTSSEYAPVLFRSDTSIIITSSQHEGKKAKADLTGGAFSDNYRYQMKDSLTWTKIDNSDNFEIVNSEYNEGSGSITADGNRFYFTRCDEKLIVDKKYQDYNCAIYVTTLKDGKWTTPVKLNENINQKGQWNAQPSVSPNADTLFFVSKRPGGVGMHDIWYSTCSGDDNWGQAINMGNKINTQGIEVSPCYYSKEQILFFSSNGHQGFGGLDIFMGKGENFGEIKNVGLPFNSNRDDFYFVMGENKGYLASNRAGGKGLDDIYTFNVKSKETVIAEINGDSIKDAKSISIAGKLLYEDTKEPAPDITNILADKEGQVLKTTQTNEKGEFRFENVPADKDYKVLMKDENPRITSEVKVIAEDIKVKKSDQKPKLKKFENIYFEFNGSELRPQSKKVLTELAEYLKKYPQTQVEMRGNTDGVGSDAYNVELSRKRGQAAYEYLVSIGMDKSSLVVNPQGKKMPIATNKSETGRQLNRRVEFYIVGGVNYEVKAMAYVVEPQMSLSRIAQKFGMTVAELKELNDISEENVSAFTAIRVRRTGDSDIIAPVSMSFADAEEQENVKVATSISNEPAGEGLQFYVVRTFDTQFSIAKKFNMTLEEFKAANKFTSDRIEIGQRVKVKQ
jgi:peptidoglycan-associated lipoprotein